jgi:DNA modification methylase
VDLIYIDPPFDSAADYVKKVKVRGEVIEAAPQGLLEEKQYSDIWDKDEYLQFLYERLSLMRELLSDAGSIYVHMDEKRSHYIKVMLDEVFGPDNFQREIVWDITVLSGFKTIAQNWIRGHDTILYYSKSPRKTFNKLYQPHTEKYLSMFNRVDENGDKYLVAHGSKRYLKNVEDKGKPFGDVWDDIMSFQQQPTAAENVQYPTQKPETLLERIIRASSNEGDLVMDCFVGSGTTCAVAQKLGRRWIGCDINIGAIQTSTKRLNQILTLQAETNSKGFKGSLGFKVLNVNEYDVFKNEVEAKEIAMEMYGIEPLKRSYFDGTLDGDFVKVLPLNRVLGKLDIRSLLKGISDEMDSFTKKTTTKHGEPVYREKVSIICSGLELDAQDFLRKENKTGIEVKILDILSDTRDLLFKQHPEAKLKAQVKDKKLSVEVEAFYSPLLMRKLELENAKRLKKEDEAKVSDFRQIIDSVTIDVDYDGTLFNAEVMDLPEKGGVVQGKYEWQYSKKGKYTVAVKIIDVLGEEYFETVPVEAK